MTAAWSASTALSRRLSQERTDTMDLTGAAY